MGEYEGKDDTRYSVASGEYARELQKLKYVLNAPPDAVMVPGGTGSEGSNLGPWFPSGRWE
jgi:hypothetical protein